ncbi:hypothetical protein BGZ65_000270, partial [Modicella reniformis]
KIGCLPELLDIGKGVWTRGRNSIENGMDLWTGDLGVLPVGGSYAWVGGDEEEDNDDDDGDDKDQEKKKGGEAARQVIWGYKGDERYLDSKYLKDESDVLLAKKKESSM